MKAFTETGFVFNYRFDAPNYAEIVDMIDNLKMSLIHNNIPYRIFPGSTFMCFFISHDNLEKCVKDESLHKRINDLIEFAGTFK